MVEKVYSEMNKTIYIYIMFGDVKKRQLVFCVAIEDYIAISPLFF